MPIKIKCPKCQRGLNANESLAGKRVACPGCKHVLVVPAANSGATSAAPAAGPVKAASPAKTPANGPAPPKAPAAAKAPAPPRSAAPAKPAAPARTPPSAKKPAAPTSSPRPPKPPEPPAPDIPPEDVEHAAAALLGDEPNDAPAPTTIDFECPMCAEPIKMALSFGGKQTPCPECNRIIKVPLPADPSKRDWRQKDNKPTAARRDDQPAPEGAWDAGRTVVSGEALDQAGALPDRPKEPLTVRQWISRGMVAAAVVLLLVAGTLSALNWLGGRREKAMLEKAMNAVAGEKPTLRGPEAAVVHLLAGAYHLNREGPYTLRPEKGDDGSLIQLGLARNKLSANTLGPEREAILIELALAQSALIGGDHDVEERRRLARKETREELLRTLNAVRLPEGRALPEARIEAMRQVIRKLIAAGQFELAEEVGRQLGDGPVSVSVAAVEFHRAGKADVATRLGTVALNFYQQKGPPVKPDDKTGVQKAPQPPLTVEAVALATILKKEKALPEAADQTEKDIIAIGQAAAAVLQGNAEKVRTLTEAMSSRPPDVRIHNLLVIADLATDESQARAAATAAVNLVRDELKDQVISPWILARLVRVGLTCGVEASAMIEVAGRIRPEDQLRSYAQLQVFRSRLAGESGLAEESLARMVDRHYPVPGNQRLALSHCLALAELTRHNVTRESGWVDAVEKWDEPLRPFGYIGAALALQASK